MAQRSNINAGGASPGAPIVLTAFEDRLLADLSHDELASALRERGLPGRRTETWKWSDLRGALRDVREPSGVYGSTKTEEAPVVLEGSMVMTLTNGVLEAPRGVEPKPIVEHGQKIGVTYVINDGLVLSHYDQGREPPAGLVSGEELEALAAVRPLISISVLPGFAHKVVLRRVSDGQGRHGDNVFVTVGEGAHLQLLETHEVTGSPFVNSRTELEIDAKAICERTIVQPAAPQAVIVHSSVVRLDELKDDQPASLRQVTLAMGAQLARHETRLTHLGESHARLDGIYKLGGDRHTDITSHVTFAGVGATTEQLVKGVGTDQARGVFQGKFLVERGAQHTDAKMAHHALLLSKKAQINAKPELEIYADDVECAHGNTVGALDPDAVFYMQQRGLTEANARGLLIEAFAGEVLQRVENETLRTQLFSLFQGAS